MANAAGLAMACLILCSIEPLPSVYLPSYDAIANLRNTSNQVVSGFQSTFEQEWLAILLAGTVPITIVPARLFDLTQNRLFGHDAALWKRVREGIEAARIEIVVPPTVTGKRVTRQNVIARNDWLLTKVDELLLLYANPGSETERITITALAQGLPVKVLNHPANDRWLNLGATTFRAEETR